MLPLTPKLFARVVTPDTFNKLVRLVLPETLRAFERVVAPVTATVLAKVAAPLCAVPFVNIVLPVTFKPPVRVDSPVTSKVLASETLPVTANVFAKDAVWDTLRFEVITSSSEEELLPPLRPLTATSVFAEKMPLTKPLPVVTPNVLLAVTAEVRATVASSFVRVNQPLNVSVVRLTFAIDSDILIPHKILK